MKRPATYRSFLTFRALDIQTDDEGGSSTAPAAVCQVWAHVGLASGNEVYIGEQLRTQTEYVIECARRSDITAKMTAVDRSGRVFEVLDVLKDDSTPRIMRIPCRQYKEKTEGDAREGG